MHNRPLRVIVDTRESNLELLAALERFDDLELVHQQLTFGDYRWPNGLVFERKTLRDLLSSLRSGRLFRQAYRLHQSRDHPALILEGTLRDLISRVPHLSRLNECPTQNGIQAGNHFIHLPAFQRVAILSALIHISVILEIPILRSTGPTETAWVMRSTALQLDPARHARRRVRVFIIGLGQEASNTIASVCCSSCQGSGRIAQQICSPTSERRQPSSMLASQTFAKPRESEGRSRA